MQSDLNTEGERTERLVIVTGLGEMGKDREQGKEGWIRAGQDWN